ncbi:hypothetical protein [Streptomyces sennicomposti]
MDDAVVGIALFDGRWTVSGSARRGTVPVLLVGLEQDTATASMRTWPVNLSAGPLAVLTEPRMICAEFLVRSLARVGWLEWVRVRLEWVRARGGP